MRNKINAEDCIGKKYGRLTILTIFRGNKNRKFAQCICECGKYCTADLYSIVSRHTQSCGCYRRESSHDVNFKHGKRNTLLYKMWSMMVDRCHNPRNQSYERYGGRGITVCDRWRKFINFYEDMGEKPGGMQLDRIDNNKGYFKENCRWTTSQQNNRNRRDSLFVEFRGNNILLKELAEQYNMPYKTVFARISYYGMTPEEAITIPIVANGKNITRLKKEGTPPQTKLQTE